MNIGEEEEVPITLPMPVDPRRIKRELPIPAAPVHEPAIAPVPVPSQPAREAEPEKVGQHSFRDLHQHNESFQEWIDAGIIEAS